MFTTCKTYMAMSNHPVKICFLFALFLIAGINKVLAQEINGDTIYVNAEAEVMVRFPSMPTYFNTTPSNAPYNFKTAGTGFTIIAKAEKTKPAPLVVNEGGRTHKFLIVFKKNLDYNNDAEMDYDYSTVKKLEMHIRENENKKQVVQSSNDDKKNNKAKKGNEDENNSSGYYALLETGDKYLKQKDYNNAKQYFEKAQKLRPDDQIPKIRLDEIKTKIEDEKKLEKLYKDYVSAGEKALKKNDYAAARISYEQALIVKKNDATATDKLKLIASKEKEEDAKVQVESNYNTAITEADKLFNAGDYDEAKTAYEKALNITKNKYPQDQLKKIEKIQNDIAAQKKAEDQKKIKENNLAAEKAKKETDYNDAIKTADKYFAAKDYNNATIAYNKALSIDKKPWPANQLKEINKILKQQEEENKKAIAKAETEKQAKERKKQEEKEKQAREKDYKAAIQEADKQFKKKDYMAAKESYMKASLLTDKSYPQDQVAAINKILDEITAKENAEKIRLAKEAATDAAYNKAVKDADAEFRKGNYIKARKLYNDAANLKPTEKLPKDKLNQIQTTLDDIAAAEKAKKEKLARDAEMKKQYVLTMSKAKSYYLAADYESAKTAYTQAASIMPAEDEPKKQLKLVEEKLEVIAKENAVNAKYEKVISEADSLLILKKYDAALSSYKAAIEIKPDEYYPHTQINYVNAEIRNSKKESEARAALDAYNKQVELDQKYSDALKAGKKAIADKNYESAKKIYSEILTYKPDDEYAQHMVKVSEFQMQRETMAKNKQPEVQQSETKEQVSTEAKTEKKESRKSKEKKATETAVVKIPPVPYTDAELKEKYPGIDFKNLPPEQPFNEGAKNTLENASIFSEVLQENPRLNISGSDNKVKLTCQGINFEGTDVYLKFLIENKSKNDFLTGAMMLTWTKKAGNKIKLYPVYLYPAFLPIITPGNQAYIIYVCKSYYIDDKEKLNFELTDRLNKTKIEITIPGKKYGEEEERY
ncbi:MAG: hypothetical protein KDC15_13225 [Chitinophagaceae bacterium]|nr:hypothetical protein [Chitinophagaceae bacterium]